MRTTLTLEDEVARRLDEEMHRHGESFKQTVNRILKMGLAVATPQGPRPEPFQVQAFDLGLREGLSYDNIGDLLEVVEGAEHL